MVANATKAGFFPSRYLNGAPYTGQCSMYFIPSNDATAVFIGDLVKIVDSGTTASTADLAMGRPIVAQAVAGASTDIHVGVVVGVNPHLGVSNSNLNLSRKHRPASVGMYVYVADDPNLVFVGQQDDVGGTGDTTIIGSNTDFVVGSGNSTSGMSAMVLDTSTATTTATLPLKIVGYHLSPDNDIAAASTGKRYEFVVNSHYLRQGTLGMAA